MSGSGMIAADDRRDDQRRPLVERLRALPQRARARLAAENWVSRELVERIADGAVEPTDEIECALGPRIDEIARRFSASDDPAPVPALPAIGPGPYVGRQGDAIRLTFHHAGIDGGPLMFAISGAYALRMIAEVARLLAPETDPAPRANALSEPALSGIPARATGGAAALRSGRSVPLGGGA